ncbi:hypothetical protein ACQP1V_01910 [Microtetraspora malaysiensis]|uniref:hypothetical protein n=1 Tax=Microtetraspora malaysiensis TaxID=161358 RepID=UPI003D8E21AD
MTNQNENFPDLLSDDSFEVVMRGYSRRQVHDYMIRTRNQIRDLEERLARTIDQAEQGRSELVEARRRLAGAPQNPEELGERLSQILKLAQEEAAANKEASQSEAMQLREHAATEAERMVTAAREQADAIRAAAQEEAERRVTEATGVAERLLAQAGSDAEETLNTARAEAEDALRAARGEADRQLTVARLEVEKLVGDARAEAHSTLTSAQQRAASLDENTGRRVAYLTDTHAEVMRRLGEIGSVLGDLLHRESAAGSLIDEAAVLPPQGHAVPQPLELGPSDSAAEDDEDIRVIVEGVPVEGVPQQPAQDGDVTTDVAVVRMQNEQHGQHEQHGQNGQNGQHEEHEQNGQRGQHGSRR